MTYCAHCGRRVDWKFCPFCGASLEGDKAVVTIGDHDEGDEEEISDFSHVSLVAKILAEGGSQKLFSDEKESVVPQSPDEEKDPGLEYKKHEMGYVVMGPGSFQGSDLKIPSTHKGLPVTGIAGFAFRHADFLVSVIIPTGVVSIGVGAFYGCSFLREILIPQTVVRIGASAFCGTDLKKIKLPEGLFVIEEGTFRSCPSLKEIDIPEEVNEIGDSAFFGCVNLSSVTFREYPRLRYIYGSAFAYCAITAITFPEHISLIGPDAFRGCKKLKKIVIPREVTEVARGAFEMCTALSEVKISGKGTFFGDNVFSDCDALSSVSFPKEGLMLPRGMFIECSSLTHVRVPEGVKSIGSMAFYECENLEYIILPSSVEDIGNLAFGKCDSLTHVFYKGDKDAWKEIAIGAQNEALKGGRVYFYSEERPYTGDLKPMSSSRFWRLGDNGDPEIWR